MLKGFLNAYNGPDSNDSTKLQMGLGAGQLLLGASINKGQRPQMQIPGAVQQANSIAQMQANATVRPGNEYAVSQINKNLGQGINTLNRSLGSSSQILSGVGQLNANANNALNENANQNTMFKFNASQNLQNSLMKLGQYQQQQFQTNQLQPYLDKVQTKNMLIGSGLQNISGATNSMTENSLYAKVFGNQTPPAMNFGFTPDYSKLDYKVVR